MNNRVVNCSRCQQPLPAAMANTGTLTPCPHCHAALLVYMFPALVAGIAAGPSAEKLVVDDQSSCFYHPKKKAVVPCESCGRFLCALCDVELNGRHWCPSCLESGKKKGRLPNLENQRNRYDQLALAVAGLPLLIWPFTLLTAPVALYIALRHWRSPGSIVTPSKWRFVLAIAIAGAQLTGWTMLFYFLLSR